MKEYIKPELIIEALSVEDMLAVSTLGIGNGTMSGDEMDAKGRRGTWGDLWSNEDQD